MTRIQIEMHVARYARPVQVPTVALVFWLAMAAAIVFVAR
jgi:hypothetical protein